MLKVEELGKEKGGMKTDHSKKIKGRGQVVNSLNKESMNYKKQ